MARDEAYRKAERKIKEAHRLGKTRLDLSVGYDEEDEAKLTEIPESLGQLMLLEALDQAKARLRAARICSTKKPVRRSTRD